MYLNIHLLLILVLISIPFNDGFQLISYSKLKSYDGGGTHFTIVGRNFISPPILKISLDGTDKSSDPFPQIGHSQDFNANTETFIYRVSDSPIALSRKRLKVDTYNLDIYTGNVKEQTFLFSYVEPSIRYYFPKEGYPNANARRISFEGSDLKLDDNEPLPTVYFDNIAGTTISCTATEIIVDLPDHIGTGYVAVAVEMYSGFRTSEISQFLYLEPEVIKIRPYFGLSTIPHRVTISGRDFYTDPIIPSVLVNIGPNYQCINYEYIDSTQIACTINAINLDEGKSLREAVDMTIGRQQALGTLLYYYYTPQVTSISPTSGISTGGTLVTVNGNFIFAVTKLKLGNQVCVVDLASRKSESFKCTTSPYKLNDVTISELVSPVMTIEDQQIQFPNSIKYTIFYPNILSISPTFIIQKGGKQSITIKGNNFKSITSVGMGSVVTTDLMFLIKGDGVIATIDSSTYGLGDIDIVVKWSLNSVNYKSPVFKLPMVKPSITGISSVTGYQKSENELTITVQNFPILFSSNEVMVKQIKFMIGTKECLRLTRNSDTEFKCFTPVGDAANQVDISFSIYGQPNVATLYKYTYYVPTITSMTQSTTIPEGGGILTFVGTHLDIIDGCKIDGKSLPFTTQCTIVSALKIECTIPPKSDGNYEVSLFVGTANEYKSPSQINYIGPFITSVVPEQWNQRRNDLKITINGRNFGTNNNLVNVMVGTQQCINIVLISTVQLTCDKPSGNLGSFRITVRVKPTTIDPYINSIEAVDFTNNALSCLGRPYNDVGGNPPKSWWFIYKERGQDPTANYLYLDNDMDEMVERDELSNRRAGPYSPLAATFDQYKDYHHLFFNDQPGSRKTNGHQLTPPKGKSIKKTRNGHMKGFIIFEETNTGDYRGIHVMHSNPVFPSYSTTTKYNQINDSLLWLGAPDFSQHYFCYQFIGLNEVMEYFVKNDGNHLKHYNIPDITTWDAAKRNRYYYFYDFMQSIDTVKYQVRDPSAIGGSPELVDTVEMKQDCKNIIATQQDTEDTCYWIGNQFQIAGNMNARYYMKIGLPSGKAKFPKPGSAKAITDVSDLVAVNRYKSPFFDGIDTWSVVAQHLDRKMFVAFFYKGRIQYDASQYVINVDAITLPPEFSPKYIDANTGLTSYSEYSFYGQSHEHSKFAFPVYPTYEDHAYDANENMFCVGDSNRHNGQGGRGGGALCFQNPILAHQFNRMTKQYNSKKGVLGRPHDAGGCKWRGSIIQRITLQHPFVWSHPIQFELKDFIGGTHYTKIPIANYVYDTTNNYIETAFQALRTTLDIDKKRREYSLGTGCQTDIMTYLADDVFSIHYTAYDVLVASICDYSATLTECNLDNARRTLIPEVNPAIGGVVFPTSLKVRYAPYLNQRTFNPMALDDFKNIKYMYSFRDLVYGVVPADRFQVLIDTSQLLSGYVSAPFIRLNYDTVCEEELSYLMLLLMIYRDSHATSANDVIFNMGTDNPNWANGMIFAMAKLIYNRIPSLTLKDGEFEACMTNHGYDDIPDIDDYFEANPGDVTNIPQRKQFLRTASATWDLMSTSYSIGLSSNRLNRDNNDDVIPYTVLYEQLITLKPSDNVNSLQDLLEKVDVKYRTTLNTQTILVNNALIAEPDIDIDMQLFVGNKHSSLLSNGGLNNIIGDGEEELNSSLSVVQSVRVDIDLQDSVFDQLLANHGPGMSYSVINKLELSSQQEIVESLEKWIDISGVNQGIQVLLIDPQQQTNSQPIQYIDKVQSDYLNEISLGYTEVENGTRVVITTPLSLVYITNFIETSIQSTISTSKSIVGNDGEFQVYFIPKPFYLDQGWNDYDGLAIATFNSKLCDIQMFTLNQFNNQQFDSICQRVGPIINSIKNSYTSSSPSTSTSTTLTGSTKGDDIITIYGSRFNSSHKIQIGGIDCKNTVLISEEEIQCTTPSGYGSSNLVQIVDYQQGLLYDIQSTLYYFQFNEPRITSLDPSTINNWGGNYLTVTGMNFGNDTNVVKVTIDDIDECSPIVHLDHENIVCITPSSSGEYKWIRVVIYDQSTQYHLNSLLNYSTPVISNIIPEEGGDPNDLITLLGHGFTNELQLEEQDISSNSSEEEIETQQGWSTPVVYFNNKQISVVNYSNSFISFYLEEGVSSANQEITIIPASSSSSSSATTTITSSYSYLPPFISSATYTSSNSILVINGYGWGRSNGDIDYIRLGEYDLDLSLCTPFNTFVECIVDIQNMINHSDLLITASVGNQTLDSNNYYITLV